MDPLITNRSVHIKPLTIPSLFDSENPISPYCLIIFYVVSVFKFFFHVDLWTYNFVINNNFFLIFRLLKFTPIFQTTIIINFLHRFSNYIFFQLLTNFFTRFSFQFPDFKFFVDHNFFHPSRQFFTSIIRIRT